MSLQRSVNDGYLQRLSPEAFQELETLLIRWELPPENFMPTLDRWFGNFQAELKPLAHKLLLNVDYYGPERFKKRLEELHNQVLRSLYRQKIQVESGDLLIVTPTGGGDSAHRHAYDLGKIWGLPRQQILSITEIAQLRLDRKVLILFNDTHGSGTQFLEDVWPSVNALPEKPLAILIVAVTIAKEAHDAFRSQSAGVEVIPDESASSARVLFTQAEFAQLSQVCGEVYPKHPLGYGGTALLTAYYFQCPNNSLPLLWADGSNNRTGASRLPWFPLFAYRPKAAGQQVSLDSASSTAYNDGPTPIPASGHESIPLASMPTTKAQAPTTHVKGVGEESSSLAVAPSTAPTRAVPSRAPLSTNLQESTTKLSSDRERSSRPSSRIDVAGSSPTSPRIGTLSDEEMRAACSQGQLIVKNFEPSSIKQACYELRASTTYHDLETRGGRRIVLQPDGYILVRPKQLLVIITMEGLRMPNDILGRVLTKGKLFSVGLLPVNTYADPGFFGHLGIVLYNLSNHYLKVVPGDAIAKIEFCRLERAVTSPYTGQHGYETGVWPVATDMILSESELCDDPRARPAAAEVEASYGATLGHVTRLILNIESLLPKITLAYFVITLLSLCYWWYTDWGSRLGTVCFCILSSTFASLLSIWVATRLSTRRSR